MRAVRSAVLAFAMALAALPATSVVSHAAVSIGISVGIAPPPLPVYTQPPIPGPGYLWIPGYWAWDADDEDYYWVPGYWQRPPRVGLLWTPGYWGWNNGAYVFNDGYWGPTVGFYGGVAYGFGYDGIGYDGGYWRGGSFFYNRAVTNVTVNITNVYARPMAIHTVNRVSFNGGHGGIAVRPTPGQLAAARTRIPPTSAQLQHIRGAAVDRSLRSKVNAGNPSITSVQHGFVGAGKTGPAGATKLHGAGATGGAALLGKSNAVSGREKLKATTRQTQGASFGERVNAGSRTMSHTTTTKTQRTFQGQTTGRATLQGQTTTRTMKQTTTVHTQKPMMHQAPMRQMQHQQINRNAGQPGVRRPPYQ